MSNLQDKKPKKSVEKPAKTGKEQEIRDEKGRFVKGVSGNPEGKKEGTKNFETEFNYFLDLWAKEKGYTLEEAKKLKFYARIKGLLKSEFSFHRDTDDRIYGKTPENINLSVKGFSDEQKQQAEEALKGFMGDNQERG